MKLTSISQPAGGPAGKPKLLSPVSAVLQSSVHYMTENGPVPSVRGIVCARTFAEVILGTMDTWALQYDFGLVHLGVYNPRTKRHRDGTDILVHGHKVWSNHAFGEAIDFRGILSDGVFYGVDRAEQDFPKKWHELLQQLNAAMAAKGLPKEFIPEGRWQHFGIHRPVQYA